MVKFIMCFGSRITGHARGLCGRHEGERRIKNHMKLQYAGEAHFYEGDVGLELRVLFRSY